MLGGFCGCCDWSTTQFHLLDFYALLLLSTGILKLNQREKARSTAVRKLMLSRACIQHVLLKTKLPLSIPGSPSAWSIGVRGSHVTTRSIKRHFATKSPPPTFAESRRIPWVLASILAGGIGLYGGALLSEAFKPCQNPAARDIIQQGDVSSRYDATADSFDSEVGLSEALMRINSMRMKLAKKCKGNVLEVSCGTGRNLGYFDISKDSLIESLTFVDLSPQMIDVCKRKWDALSATILKKKSHKPGLVIRFLTASALDTMPSAPGKEKYDTIIQTMGLCSTPSPQKLLINMVNHLDTSNPDARVLLLEHGRSYRAWLNNILDNAAPKHAEVHGCWFNRDIGAIVTDAARQAGLRIVSERRHHLGTTWIFELAPDEDLLRKNRGVDKPVAEAPPKPGWRSWLGLT